MPSASDLVAYLSANHPEDDVATAGGARSAVGRPLDAQMAANAVITVQSDAAGDTTQTLTAAVREPAGTRASDPIALNGTTEVAGAVTAERVLTLTLSAVAVGNVTVRQGLAGPILHVFAPGETFAAIGFIDAAADPALQQQRYEKYFFENSHATEALIGAQIQLSADPQSNYEIAVAGAVDDTETTTDRTTAPSGETFVDDGVDQAVPGTDLAAQTAAGFWIRQTLAAAEAAGKETFTAQLSGTSV